MALSVEQLKWKFPCLTSAVWRDVDPMECVGKQAMFVMLSFDAESLPDKVKVGSVSYTVTAFCSENTMVF